MKKRWLSKKELSALVRDFDIVIISIGLKNEVKWRKKGLSKTYFYEPLFFNQSIYSVANAIVKDSKQF